MYLMIIDAITNADSEQNEQRLISFQLIMMLEPLKALHHQPAYFAHQLLFLRT